MSPGFLEAGSAAVVLAILLVLMAYLYIVGDVVRHIAETLEDKIAAGAGEVEEHAAAIAPAASGLTAKLRSLAHSHRAVTG